MLHALSKITTRSKKRVGRGIGSGKGGHTAGRGAKGHKARQGGNIPLWFEGGQLPLIKRLPYLRGKFRFKSLNAKPLALRVSQLSTVEGGVVSPETLVAAGLIRSVITPVKIVSGGDVPTLKEVRGVSISQSAKSALEKAGCAIY
jgi:large subunit ribosomal protein L15